MWTRLIALSVVVAACASNDAASTPSLEATARQELIAKYGAEGTICGRIVDEQGRPVVGARLHVGVYTLSDSTPTDRDGRYVVGVGQGYPNGEDIHLSVRAGGFLTAHVGAPLGAREHVIVMSRGAGVRAQLVADGGELEGRTVTVSSRRGDVQEATLHGGRFEVFGLTPDERQILQVRVAGFVPQILTGLDLGEGAVLELGALELEPGGTLEVIVRDAFDEPVPDAYVNVIWDADLQASWSVLADESGVARIEGLPCGVELEVATKPPQDFGRGSLLEREVRALTLASDGEKHVEAVLLRRLVALRGRMTWGGSGPAPWRADQRLRIEGVATGEAGERWTHTGSALGRGAPLGEGEADFVLWARPGAWNLDLRARRDWDRTAYAARLADLEIPEPAQGERSGELDVGVVVFGPTAR